MVTRIQKRMVHVLIVVFLFTGYIVVDQRPLSTKDHTLLAQIQELMPPPVMHFASLAEKPKTPQPAPDAELADCTAFSPTKGFIDLRALASQDGRAQPWTVKGHDGALNFTLGICSSPVKKQQQLQSPRFRDDTNLTEVGAWYMDPKTKENISIGQFTGTPVFNGRKLTLAYENGSYCDSVQKPSGEKLRRSTLITFTCDRELLNKAHVSYIALAYDCTYMFEVRSHLACPTAAKADNLAAIWIFVLILLAALLVFFLGSLLFKKKPGKTIQ